ncbi:MAG: efflux RND transporter periplasmic adaptor subunit [Bauldia sp.]|uniref:HlyD family secretion protein n=1 Tax=Bauldia sp. TaxID=2575872 RepID=UPI001E05406F|nr:efflux RND transporter periplasmic adaptor subunit [Bauldia sp.]MCB1496999.1 efflux RND transporter periplasmic adaptor subunit [Bauldia sp.]
MGVALVITIVYIIAVYLVFFRFKWLKFSIVWGVVSFWIGFHLMLIFMIGLRFYAPFTVDAHLIRNTIQIIPRLEGPTLLTDVLVKPNEPIKKGTPLYKFDTTIYEQKLLNARAQLAAAQQNLKVMDADVDQAQQQLVQAQSELAYAKAQQDRFTKLASQGGARQEDVDKWNAEVESDNAAVAAASANLQKAQLQRDSSIDGVNTSVAQAQAQVAEAQYYLDNTTLVAPEDGYIVSQQARPGMVVGDFRVGAIAAFVTMDDPYMLGAFFQEHIKFVEPGQTVEVALDTAPGEIYTGKVEAIWWATAQGQYLPTGRLPEFILPKLQGKFAVQVSFDDKKAFLPAGAHGAIAVYTGRQTAFEVLRKINIRLYSFANFIVPFDL